MKILLLQTHDSYQTWHNNLDKIAQELSPARIAQVDLIILPLGALLGLANSESQQIWHAEFQEKHAKALASLAELAGSKHILYPAYLNHWNSQSSSKLIVYHFDPKHKNWRILQPETEYLSLGNYRIALAKEQIIAQNPPDIMVDFMPQTYSQRLYQSQAVPLCTSYIQLQAVAALNGKIYPGASQVYQLGQLIFQFPIAESACWIYDLTAENSTLHPQLLSPVNYPQLQLSPHHLASLLQVMTFAVRDFVASIGKPKVIIGLSGGIDSALCLALAVLALGAEQVHTVFLPSQFSSTASEQDTQELVRLCGVEHQVLPIDGLYQQVLTTLAKPFANLPFSVAEENIQSRLRSLLLMALANKFDHILLNTSNKSELCMGYGTLYGDLAGALGVLGDLYKTQVYSLAHYINQHVRRLIPESVLRRPPSAELRPNQKDSDSLPEYADLDPVLFALVDEGRDLAELRLKGGDEEQLRRIWQTMQKSSYKLRQFCPVLQLSLRPLA